MHQDDKKKQTQELQQNVCQVDFKSSHYILELSEPYE